MGFNWAEYLELAERLCKSNDEASQRSAISRAYYSAFHAANNRALANNYRRSEDGTTHQSLWSYYERNPNEECQRIAIIGKRLLEKRVRADYRDTYARIGEELAEVLINARRCATMIAALPPQFPEEPPPRVFSY